VAQLKKSARKKFTTPVIVVPSGNFGNLTAALYAEFLGNETRSYIAATNANNVVGEYLDSGKYQPRPSLQTLSNAMDVGNPSNLARIDFLFGRDLTAFKEMVEVMSVDDAETLDEITQTFKESKYIADPHTAVGLRAARRFQKGNPGVPVIVASTAHPAKFPEVINKALGKDIPVHKALEEALNKRKQAKRIAASLTELRKAF
jgi:threonine synthase